MLNLTHVYEPEYASKDNQCEGNLSGEFINYSNSDYLKSEDSQISPSQHQCKIGFVSVIDPVSNKLSAQVGQKVIDLLEI